MKIVAYYRVSTKRQGRSGLGLEAQKLAVEMYANSIGAQIIAEFTEIETGKTSDRPQLIEAIVRTQMVKGTLVIAKLDRLARNVAFVSALMEGGVEFVCCDLPTANRFTLHIHAAVAEDEARRISERTKVALAVAKDKGKLLGSSRPDSWKGLEDRRAVGQVKATRASAKVRVSKAVEYANRLKQHIDSLPSDWTFDRIAAELNQQGLLSPRGASITKSLVSKVLRRVS